MGALSSNTNARSEGDLRREWNLAVNRMLDAKAASLLISRLVKRHG
jgi:hypothetical protein